MTNTKIHKVIILIIVLVIAILFGSTISYAKDISKSDLTEGNSNIGNKLNVRSIHRSANLYCAQQTQEFGSGKHKVFKYVKIVGNDCTGSYNASNKDENLKMAYIVANGDYTDNCEKVSGHESQTGQASYYTHKQLGIWKYIDTWGNAVGGLGWHGGHGGAGYHNYDNSNRTQQIMARAQNYVNEYKNSKAKIISTNSPISTASLTSVGPFNMSFSGTVTGIIYTFTDGTVSDGSGLNISCGPITSGGNFYVANNTGKKLKSITVTVSTTGIIANIWFLEKSSSQKIMYATGYNGLTDTASATIEVLPTGSITINKKDQATGGAIPSVQFKVQNASNGAWYGPYSTNENGSLKIEPLPLGTYNIYETALPGGYDLSHQGAISSGMVYRGQATCSTVVEDVSVSYTNTKKVIISGFVWEQTPATKQNQVDGSIYANGMTRISGVTVKLKVKGNNALVTSATTNSSGAYTFPVAVAENQLHNYYVEFDYSKTNYKKYIPVTFNSSNQNGSRALVKDMPVATGNPPTKDSEDGLAGIATTYQGSTSETTYGLSGTLKSKFITRNTATTADQLKYINLGLKTAIPDYTINQNIAYVKIVMNGYTYKYNYGSAGNAQLTKAKAQSANIYTPNVNWQSKNSISAYTRAIYPSDIQYSINHADEGLQVYVVYRIDVTNTTSFTLDYLYYEKKLHITSLTNQFDTERYEINSSSKLDSEDSKVKEDFARWTGTGNTVTYDKAKFSGGITPNQTKTAYIQFKVKKSAISNILNHPNGIIESLPTTSTMKAYHEFERYDYSWSLNISSSGKQTHTTAEKTQSSSAPYLIFKLGPERKITGKVFKDKVITNNGEKLGNGKIDDGEQGIAGVKVELVKATKSERAAVFTNIEDVSKLETALIYPNNTGVKAETTTNSNGEYTISNIVPGEYYLRFTYGDGTQKIKDLNGNDITLTALDYKSTIVKSQSAKEALKKIKNVNTVKQDEYVNKGSNTNTLKDNFIWYKHLDVGIATGNIETEKLKYSVAVDSLSTRKKINKNAKDKAIASKSITSETEETETEGTGSESETATEIVAVAGTSRISVTIENTQNSTSSETYSEQNNQNASHAENFGGMNLGIIEQPRQRINVEKEIIKIKNINAQGNVMVSGNPATEQLQGVSDLTNPKLETGSKYTKMELQEDDIYGATLELTYNIKITNTSDVNYYNEEYYKFGDANENKEVTITIETLKDSLDGVLTFMERQGATIGLNEVQGRTEIIDKKSYKIIKSDSNYLPMNNLYTSKKHDEEADTSKKFKVVAQKILSTQDDDMEFINHAEVPLVFDPRDAKSNADNTPSRADKDSNAQEQIERTIISTIDGLDQKAKATITITPPTGLDLQTILIYSAATEISLAILLTGIIIIKKKILAKE